MQNHSVMKQRRVTKESGSRSQAPSVRLFAGPPLPVPDDEILSNLISRELFWLTLRRPGNNRNLRDYSSRCGRRRVPRRGA